VKPNHNNQKPQLPTRVVDVGTAECPYVRLHETVNETGAVYIALSHCWGAASTVPQTNMHNIVLHKGLIPDAVLSKTFKHAIEVTRGLGVRYLWIDSLCIIQGSAEDWTREAARMGQVYSQAALTLAAVSSTNGQGGLFQTPDLREIRMQYGPRNVFGCWLRLPFKDDLYSTLLNANSMAREYTLPLLTRKWAFQERLLSRRIAYFAEEELAWECRTSTHC
jgi:hypothetical protein